MATKLINRLSHAAFIDYIRTAPEFDAWSAIGDGWYVVKHARISKVSRAARRRTVEQAMDAYKQTHGEAWVPF